ncbi:hypothetical protein G6F50_013902 [Rhizopus delemar]|uniref:Uncharacterized protein n=1 Tax=Rhizopus delemar TaxID=936053 RepID=A0A9P6YBH2_9FUNG|nr:hypothetical protein G6F50_013902 [Rhizopus delemar]
MTHSSLAPSTSATTLASSSDATARMPTNGTWPLRVSTRLVRPGSTRPIDSAVLRPIRIGLPRVSALKCLKSSGRCQGMALPWPMPRLRSSATIIDSFIALTRPPVP